MTRFLPLLLCVIAGCGHAAASIPHLQFAAATNAAVRQDHAAADEDEHGDIEPSPSPSPLPPAPPAPPVPITPVTPVIPTLTLPEYVEGKVGSFVKVPATTNGKEVRWRAIDDGIAVFPAEMLRDSRSTVVSATEAGEYRLLAYTALNDIPSDPAVCVVRITGPPKPQPPPTPPAPPAPPVPPQPPAPVVTTGPIAVAVIDDAFARTDTLKGLMRDIDFWKSISARTGYSTELIDAANPEASKYKPWTDKTGLPAIVLRDGTTGKVRYSGPLPLDRSEISALVKSYSGK